MGPGLYFEIGKKARDLLYNNYSTDQRFVFTTSISNGVAVLASGVKKDDLIFGEILSQIQSNNFTFDAKVNSDSNLLTTITHELGTPGLKAIFSLVVPDQRSAKVEFQYLHDYAGVSASVGLTTNPIVNMSGVFGTKAFSVGADVAFDTSNGNFTKYNVAVSITNAELIASLSLNNQGDGISASYYHMVNRLKSTAVGAELVHSFSNNISTVIFGTQHAIDRFTLVKARFNSYSMASALVQHEWRPKSFFTLSAEIDTKSIEKTYKIGLAVVLNA